MTNERENETLEDLIETVDTFLGGLQCLQERIHYGWKPDVNIVSVMKDWNRDILAHDSVLCDYIIDTEDEAMTSHLDDEDE